MNSFNPNYFLHAANVLLLVAYSARDILWLRLFALVSALIAIPYFVLQPAPLWVPIGWSSVFAAINLFQSWRLFVERRPVKLSPEEEEVRRLAFEDLPTRKVLQVLSVGSWITTKTGERMLERGKSPEAISLIVRGTVRVTGNEGVLGDLVAGHLVGSALLLPALRVLWMQWQLNQCARCVGRLKRWSVILMLIPKFGSYCNGTWLVTLAENWFPICGAVVPDTNLRDNQQVYQMVLHRPIESTRGYQTRAAGRYSTNFNLFSPLLREG